MEEKTEQPAEAPAELPTQKNAVLAILALLRNPTLIVGIVAALLLGGMLAWKISAVSSLETRFAAEKSQITQQAKAEAQAEISKAIDDGKKALANAQRDKLTVLAKPLAWALHDQVIADNQKQINDYIGELVKVPGFSQIVLARVDGSIALASDSTMIDGRLEKIYPVGVTKSKTPLVLDSGNGKLILAVPVMRDSEKMALLVLTYDPAASSPPVQ